MSINIGGRQVERHQILEMIVLLIGLALGLYLVQQQVLLRSKGAGEVTKAFEITDKEGNPLTCSGDTCETKSLEVQIKLENIGVLEQLTE
ncbi:MAG: hypothetical protein Q7S60_04490 [bacterium]|nr:hypothetical protein [bacterium]